MDASPPGRPYRLYLHRWGLGAVIAVVFVGGLVLSGIAFHGGNSFVGVVLAIMALNSTLAFHSWRQRAVAAKPPGQQPAQ